MSRFLNMLNSNLRRHNGELIDELAYPPEATFWSKWCGGVIIPLVILRYGVLILMTNEAKLFARHGTSLELSGNNAIAMGIAWLFVALFLNFHFFWSAIPRIFVVSYPGKLLALIGFIASFGYVLWSLASGWAL